MTVTAGRSDPERVETATLALKAPVEWFARLDRWRLAHPQKPSRPASIRWIVWRFLEAEEAKAMRARARQRQVRRSK